MQFDLFIDAPDKPMNPNKFHYPDCFESEYQFNLWKGEAYRAKEQATICEDCTKEYKAKMMSQGRCHEAWTRENSIVYKSREIPHEILQVFQGTRIRSTYKPQGSGGNQGSGPTTHGIDLQLFVRAWTAGQRRDRQSDWLGPESSSEEAS